MVGIIAESALNIPPRTIGCLFAVSLSFLILSRGTRLFVFAMSVCAIMLGAAHYFSFHMIHDNDILRLVRNLDQHKFISRSSLQGIVWSQPETKVSGKRVSQSFILKAEDIMMRRNGEKELMRVQGYAQVFLINGEQELSVGQRVRIWGELKSPHEPLNPGQFNYKDYLALRGIHAVFMGYGKKSIRVIGQGKIGFVKGVTEQAREFLVERIDLIFVKHQGFFKAILLGLRKELNPEIRENFVKTGTAHLLAISGLHITLVAGAFFLFCLLCGAPQKGAATLSIFVVTGYVLIAGAGIPVKRSGIMAISIFLALILERRNQFWNSFSAALLIVLLMHPDSLMNVAFQLSFASVFFIFFFLSHSRETLRWSKVFNQSLAVMIGTFPLIIYYFHIFSPISLVANMVAIPLFHLTLLSALAALLCHDVWIVGEAFQLFAVHILDIIFYSIQYLSKLEWGYFYVSSPSIRHIVFYYCILIFALPIAKYFKGKGVWIRPILFSLWMLCFLSFLEIQNRPFL